VIFDKMHTDYVFPDGNEEEFIEMALKLGYGGLCFIYRYDRNTDNGEKIKKLQEKTKLKLSYGFLASLKDTNKIKTKNLIFVKGSAKNRFFIEKKKADVLFSLEDQKREDFMHHRASGLNHVLCTLANKNKISVGFSFNMLLKDRKNLYKILGRMMQNIQLCRKFKVKTLIGSFAERPFEMRAANDLISLFSVLGTGKEEMKGSFGAASKSFSR